VTPDPAVVAAPNNRVLAEQVYDAIMAGIEEDLLLANIPHLPEKYKNETPEEHESRMERYKDAYRKFDQEFSKLMVQVNDEVHTQKRGAQSKRISREIRRGNQTPITRICILVKIFPFPKSQFLVPNP